MTNGDDVGEDVKHPDWAWREFNAALDATIRDAADAWKAGTQSGTSTFVAARARLIRALDAVVTLGALRLQEGTCATCRGTGLLQIPEMQRTSPYASSVKVCPDCSNGRWYEGGGA